MHRVKISLEDVFLELTADAPPEESAVLVDPAAPVEDSFRIPDSPEIPADPDIPESQEQEAQPNDSSL
jgi:hypothetical protein